VITGILCISTNPSLGFESRIQIALIDTGIKAGVYDEYLCKSGHKDFTGLGLNDNLGHGTAMAGAIIKYVSSKTHCIINIKWYDPEYNSINDLPSAIEYASISNAEFMNISAGGGIPDIISFEALNVALTRGMVISVAAGNDSWNLDLMCNHFPSCYNYGDPDFHIVGALNKFGKPAYFSNYGYRVTDWEFGVNIKIGEYISTGTSIATATLTGKLAANAYRNNL